MRVVAFGVFLFLASAVLAQDTLFLQVHFLYGSRPKRAYKEVEPKWFGGVWGGHVGVAYQSDSIVNFVPRGKFHVRAHKRDLHSAYAIHNEKDFYAILGSSERVKRAVVYIPITRVQAQRFDSLTVAYLTNTPYDYALMGMRCGAAAYDMLSQVNVLPRYGYSKTWRRISYPRRLRKRLFRLARQHDWLVVRQGGSPRRKWEHD